MKKLTPETLITCHASPDFDCLGSMVAAGKLYENATLVLPQYYSKHMVHPFIEGMHAAFGFVSPQDCDFTAVKRLILVDTRSPKRLEHIASLLKQSDIEVTIYDHHPERTDDIQGNIRHIAPTGSTVTILTSLLKAKHIPLTPQEATMLCLGLYADTGSFKHITTTPEDFKAGAYLCQYQPDFSVLKSLTSDITGDQVHLLDLLLKSTRNHNIHGHTITIAEVNLDQFYDDFSSVIDKAMALENFTVFITLAAMNDRVHLIARSNVSTINVGKLCTAFGGGGHASAASAVIKGTPLAEVLAQLMAMLLSITDSESTVKFHMTSPAKTITSTTSLQEAETIMSRFGLKAVPVIDSDTEQCIGILEQQIAARAATHGLGYLLAKEYTHNTFYTLPPDADLMEAITIILRHRQRLVPIIDNSKVIGVLTRTDLIKLMISEPLHMPEVSPYSQERKQGEINLILQNQLEPDHLQLLKKIGVEADLLNVQAFVVGGFVRDLLLKRKNLDFDISIEGDAIAFAQHLAKTLNGRVRVHEKFQTAIVFYQDSFGYEQHLDIATARLEFYEHPGALPQVELSSIEMDLFRRDFTINALALQINKEKFGRLIDPFGAQRDIQGKTISALHSLSFIEDPTRILRAVRFEQRFDFTISTHTERLIKSALQHNMIQQLSGGRIFNELRQVFEEKNAPSCIRRMHDWKLLGMIHPGLRLTPTKDILLSNTQEVISWYRVQNLSNTLEPWKVYLNALCGKAKYPEVSSILERLGFVTSMRKKFLAARVTMLNLVESILALHKDQQAPHSAWYLLLNHLPVESLLFLMANLEHPGIRQRISHYLTHLQNTTIRVSGEDLLALGEKPGPLFKETLDHVLLAVMDGLIDSKEEQLDYAYDFMQRRDDSKKGQEAGIFQALQGRT